MRDEDAAAIGSDASVASVALASLCQEALGAQQAGQFSQAADIYRRILSQDPLRLDAHSRLTCTLLSLGQAGAAIAALKQSIAALPTEKALHIRLANAFRDAKFFEAALAAYRCVLAQHPDNSIAYYNLGLTFCDLGRYREAGLAYRAAINCEPWFYEAHLNIGALYEEEGRLSEAIQHYLAGLAACPDRAAAYNNLGTAWQSVGRLEEALAIAQRAFLLDRGSHRVASNVLMSLQYLPGISDAALLDAARSYGSRFLPQARPVRHAAHSRPLRIGYVSGDFCAHPVGLLLKNVIANHDTSQFRIYCYSDNLRLDKVGSEIAGTSEWRPIAAIYDDIVIEGIAADEIDILVDLAGHSADNRLPLFARRPAPLLVSWLGYFATTGLPAMDCIILDPYHAPQGSEANYTERIIRLPHNRFCYSPVEFAPEVAPPPFQGNGFVTFGSFNNTGKLNAAVLECWSRILAAVPQSRLILKWRTFADPAFRQTIAAFFAARGIAPERLELRAVSPHRQLLAEYADIDIALDPFPFCGGYTSCEALWMGVPVVTLPQQRLASRQTWSFLSNIGLAELAAADPDAYVLLAVDLAGNRDGLSTLRSTLRQRMRCSPLCDVIGFTRNLEQAYLLAWESVGNT